MREEFFHSLLIKEGIFFNHDYLLVKLGHNSSYTRPVFYGAFFSWTKMEGEGCKKHLNLYPALDFQQWKLKSSWVHEKTKELKV